MRKVLILDLMFKVVVMQEITLNGVQTIAIASNLGCNPAQRKNVKMTRHCFDYF